MKRTAIIGATLAMMMSPTPTLAQHVSPSDTNVVFEGFLDVNGLTCLITMPSATGPNVGVGAHWQHATKMNLDPGTLTGSTCNPITLVATDFEIDTFDPTGGAAGLGSITGTLNNAEIKYGIPTVCFNSGPLPIYGENMSLFPNEVYITFSGRIDGCGVYGDVEVSGIKFVP